MMHANFFYLIKFKMGKGEETFVSISQRISPCLGRQKKKFNCDCSTNTRRLANITLWVCIVVFVNVLPFLVFLTFVKFQIESELCQTFNLAKTSIENHKHPHKPLYPTIFFFEHNVMNMLSDNAINGVRDHCSANKN